MIDIERRASNSSLAPRWCNAPYASAYRVQPDFARRLQQPFGVLACLAGIFASHAACAQQVAAADPYDLLTPFVTLSNQWDDNLFRLPDGQHPEMFQGQDSRSDEIRNIDLGVRLDKVYGQQRLTVDVDVNQYHFSTYSYLDFLAKNADATWAFAVTPDVTGHVIYLRQEFLNSFADFTATSNALEQNIGVNQTRRVDADWRFAGALHSSLALYQTTSVNSAPTYATENVKINSIEPGLNYLSLAGNSLGLYGRAADGTYVNQQLDAFNQVDNAFHEHEYGARVSYAVDGQTDLFAQVGELQRDNDHFASRNFSGLVGVLKWSWLFSPKTSAQVTASRTIGSYVSTTSSYVISNRILIGPTWTPTAKTSLSASYQETQYSFEDSLIPTQLRRDRNSGFVLSAQWSPLRELLGTLTLNKSSRSSNLPGLQYADTRVTLSAKVTF